MGSWCRDLLNLILPPECHVCGCRLAPSERFACNKCISDLPRSGYHRRELNPMEERFAGIFPFRKASGHFLYSKDSPIAVLIQDMKYNNFPSIGIMLGEIVGRELYPTGFFNDTDALVPVPMHYLKKAKRGYNQTEKIAEGIGKSIDCPVADALRMNRRHSTQTSLSREERLQNTKNLFSLKEKGSLDGLNVVLIDDVCTSGATLTAAAEGIWKDSTPNSLTLLTLGVTF